MCLKVISAKSLDIIVTFGWNYSLIDQRYYNNRAASHIRLNNYEAAIVDADKAIALFQLRNANTSADANAGAECVDAAQGAKSYYRRGECLAAQGKFAHAADAYAHALIVEPANKDIASAHEAAQLALRHPELISTIVHPSKPDRASLVLLRQASDAVQHNLRVLRGATFAKDVTFMTQKLQNVLRCIQYVLVDSAGLITSTNGSNSLQAAGLAEKLAEGKVIVCHMFVHVDVSTHKQEYMCESGEDSNRFKGKPWNTFQQTVLLMTVKEASGVGIFNEFIPNILFKNKK